MRASSLAAVIRLCNIAPAAERERAPGVHRHPSPVPPCRFPSSPFLTASDLPARTGPVKATLRRTPVAADPAAGPGRWPGWRLRPATFASTIETPPAVPGPSMTSSPLSRIAFLAAAVMLGQVAPVAAQAPGGAVVIASDDALQWCLAAQRSRDGGFDEIWLAPCTSPAARFTVDGRTGRVRSGIAPQPLPQRHDRVGRCSLCGRAASLRRHILRQFLHLRSRDTSAGLDRGRHRPAQPRQPLLGHGAARPAHPDHERCVQQPARAERPQHLRRGTRLVGRRSQCSGPTGHPACRPRPDGAAPRHPAAVIRRPRTAGGRRRGGPGE